MLFNATCIALDNKGVLIVGPPGAGKSDLALRLIECGAQLVADDQTELHIKNDELLAEAPKTIKGLFEVRHVGLLRMPFVSSVRVALYVELALLHEKLERLPQAHTITLLDREIPRLKMPSFAASTPAKIRAILSYPLAGENT